MFVATDPVIRQAEELYHSFELAKLKAYQLRPGNPNQIVFSTFGKTVAARGSYVGNWVYGFAKEQIHALPQIIQFFAETRTDFKLTISTLEETQEMGRALIEQGFKPWMYHAKLYADLSEVDPSSFPSDIVVNPVDANRLDAFSEIMMEGWDIPREHWNEAIMNMRQRFTIPGVSLFLGGTNEYNMGGGMLYVNEDTAYLADAATVPSSRRIGCQMAVMAARIAKAKESRCKYLFGCAYFRTASFRNMQRAGLMLASCDMTWYYQFEKI